MFQIGPTSLRCLTVTAVCQDERTLGALGHYLQSRVSFRGVLDIDAALQACAGSDTVVLYPGGFMAMAVQRLLRKLILNHTISLVILMSDEEAGWVSSRLLSSHSRLVVLPAQVLPPALLAIIQSSVPSPRLSRKPS